MMVIDTIITYILLHIYTIIYWYMAVCQNLVPLVNIKIAGKWMFIPLKMVLIGIDPYPYIYTIIYWYIPIISPLVIYCTHLEPLQGLFWSPRAGEPATGIALELFEISSRAIPNGPK